MSAAARQGVKDQLGKWKKDQEEKKMSDIQASMQHKTRIDNSAKRKRDRDREGTKEQIEEYKFRKQMDQHREKMLENMEKNKKTTTTTTEQK